MAQLHADENFDYRVVVELRQRGHDILTAHEPGRAGQRIPDADVLAFAVSQNRAILTFNRRDYIRLHTASQAHCGIIVWTNDSDVAGLATRIHDAILRYRVLNNRLIHVNPPRTP